MITKELTKSAVKLSIHPAKITSDTMTILYTVAAHRIIKGELLGNCAWKVMTRIENSKLDQRHCTYGEDVKRK